MTSPAPASALLGPPGGRARSAGRRIRPGGELAAAQDVVDGIALRAAALGFYFLYLRFVYPVTEP